VSKKNSLFASLAAKEERTNDPCCKKGEKERKELGSLIFISGKTIWSLPEKEGVIFFLAPSISRRKKILYDSILPTKERFSHYFKGERKSEPSFECLFYTNRGKNLRCLFLSGRRGGRDLL